MTDTLQLSLRELPYFRALLRSVEARFYQDLDLPQPVLDLGCGDGHFSSLTFEDPLDVGLDPWWPPIQEATRRDGHHSLVCAGGASMPFPDGFFRSGISNSVLEHIPHLDPVLKELARVLSPGAPFVFSVPNHRFLDTLSVGQALDHLGLEGMGNRYRSFFNRISRHHHCDSQPVWQARLEKHGFEIQSWWDYFSPRALHTLEWGHYFGLPSQISRWLTGRWVIIPRDWNIFLTRRLIEGHYHGDPRHDQGAYTFYITRRL